LFTCVRLGTGSKFNMSAISANPSSPAVPCFRHTSQITGIGGGGAGTDSPVSTTDFVILFSPTKKAAPKDGMKKGSAVARTA
jgi:hypothetical protein